MNSDHPTMGDIAYGEAQSNARYIRNLESRVTRLENNVQVLSDHNDYLVGILNAVMDHLLSDDQMFDIQQEVNGTYPKGTFK